MKRSILAILFMLAIINSKAQDAKGAMPEEVKIGDVLKIGRSQTPRYKYIYFPRPNFIIKKGGIANYKRVKGHKVIVTTVKEKKDGTLQIKIKRADGGKFFNSHNQVLADLKNALQSGELRIL